MQGLATSTAVQPYAKFKLLLHTKFNLVPLNSRTRVEKFQRVADFLLRYMYELFEHFCISLLHSSVGLK